MRPAAWLGPRRPATLAYLSPLAPLSPQSPQSPLTPLTPLTPLMSAPSSAPAASRAAPTAVGTVGTVGTAGTAGGPPPARGVTRIGRGRAFGTFGELIQGALPPYGRDFLITLPVDRWATAEFRPVPGAGLTVSPGDRHKSRRLAQLMLHSRGLDPGGVLILRGELLVGKGMASSSADLVATARAVGDAHGFVPSPAEIEDLARLIEPTDGVMYDSCVAFYHREVRLLADLGPLPALTVVGVDEGGVVDTVEFNRLPKAFTAEQLDEYDTLLSGARDAVKAGHTEELGRLATRSAELNQRLRPKALLAPVRTLARDVGALGVAAAHSGTTLGVLLDRSDPDHDRKLACVRRRLAAAGWAPTVDRTLAAGPDGPDGPDHPDRPEYPDHLDHLDHPDHRDPEGDPHR